MYITAEKGAHVHFASLRDNKHQTQQKSQMEAIQRSNSWDNKVYLLMFPLYLTQYITIPCYALQSGSISNWQNKSSDSTNDDSNPLWYAVSSGKWLLTFQRIVVPSSARIN
jgi:hypothetical protein